MKGLHIIPVAVQPKLHQFNSDELAIIKLGSNPDKFDKLIFKQLEKG